MSSIKRKCVLDEDKCQGTSSLVPPDMPIIRASAPEKQAQIDLELAIRTIDDVQKRLGTSARLRHVPSLWLVCCGFLGPIDNKYRQRDCLRIQFQPKLLLDGSGD
jgi:hypothetical protein